MPKLHLVGITPDHRGLVLSEHARAKRGDMVLEIDDRLGEAIAKAQRLRTQDEGERLESNALPSRRESANGEGGAAARPTPREIQQRLRAGESVTAIARSSGTDEAWIRRFAPPVLAEQGLLIEQALALTFVRRGVGPSAVALGPAVAANVSDRGVVLTPPEVEAGWSAYQRSDCAWRVTFTFPGRGRRQTAEWELDSRTGELIARNKLATEIGWRAPERRQPPARQAKASGPKREPVRRPTPAPEPAAETLPGTAERPGHSVQELPLAPDPAPPAPDQSREAASRTRRKPQVTKRTAAATAGPPAKSVVAVSAPVGPPAAPSGGPPAA